MKAHELPERNIHVYPPNQSGESWIVVKFGVGGPHSSIEAVGATEALALSTLRLKLAGHWIPLETAHQASERHIQ